jgi:hypothetical protein
MQKFNYIVKLLTNLEINCPETHQSKKCIPLIAPNSILTEVIRWVFSGPFSASSFPRWR